MNLLQEMTAAEKKKAKKKAREKAKKAGGDADDTAAPAGGTAKKGGKKVPSSCCICHETHQQLSWLHPPSRQSSIVHDIALLTPHMPCLQHLSTQTGLPIT